MQFRWIARIVKTHLRLRLHLRPCLPSPWAACTKARTWKQLCLYFSIAVCLLWHTIYLCLSKLGVTTPRTYWAYQCGTQKWSGGFLEGSPKTTTENTLAKWRRLTLQTIFWHIFRLYKTSKIHDGGTGQCERVLPQVLSAATTKIWGTRRDFGNLLCWTEEGWFARQTGWRHAIIKLVSVADVDKCMWNINIKALAA